MLGIRKFFGTAIDLWQGDIARFVGDAVASIPAGADRPDCETIMSEGLALAEQGNARHLAVVVNGTAGSESARTLMTSVRRFLESRGSKGAVRRITFVLGNGSVYETFQDELFREFPES